MLSRVERDLLVYAGTPLAKKYLRQPDEAYPLSADGRLKPAKKD